LDIAKKMINDLGNIKYYESVKNYRNYIFWWYLYIKFKKWKK
jgi:hypothetical protein